jgi:hypothetical protein
MVAVAAVALLIHGGMVRRHRLNLANLCDAADRGVRHTGARYRLDDTSETLRTVAFETPARTPAEIEDRRLRSAYWIALKQKYGRAALVPWLPVAPDPSEPE